MRKNLNIILYSLALFFIISLLLIPALPNEKKYLENLRLASEKLNDKYYSDALYYFQKAQKYSPSKDVPYLEIANLYLLKENTAAAKETLQTGIKKASPKDNLYYKLGEIFLEEYDLDNAENSFSHINDSNPQKVLSLSKIYYKNGNSLKAFQQVELLNIENSSEDEYLKSLYYLFENPEEISQILPNASTETKISNLLSISKEENQSYRHLLLSQELISNGYPELTISPLQKIIAEKPDYREAYLILAHAYFETHKYPETENILNRILEIDPAYAESYYFFAEFSLFQNDLEKAISLAEKAISLDKNNPKFYRLFAFLYDKKGNCEEKIKIQEKIVNDLTLWQTPKELLSNQKQLLSFYLNCGETDPLYDLSDKIQNSDAETKEFFLYASWLKNQDLSESLSAYQSLLSENPYLAIAHSHYAELLLQNGQAAEAQKEKDRASDLFLN